MSLSEGLCGLREGHSVVKIEVDAAMIASGL